MMPDFLFELGCEEIPARMLDSGAGDLGRRVAELLVAERLTEKPEVEIFSTPRRLAVLARAIRASQPDLEEQVLGPSTKVAFKDGKPTPAAEAFARKVSLDPSRLDKITTPKGEYLAAHVTRKGRTAAEVLAEKLPAEVLRLHWPKTMYWRGKAAERFVRPVRWLVAMLDGQVIPMELGGVRATSTSLGHRTISSGPVEIPSPAAYAEALDKAGVVASRAAREQRIRKALDAATRAVPGARWREDAALLSTVVNLTEFPSALLGNFDREFLALPEEVLVTVMRDHQKYFAVESADGKLAPHFLAVLNTDSDPDGAIRHGHERVLRARFADARFFWEADQKRGLRDRVELLKAVTFQKDLGSYYQKTERVAALANRLAADVSGTHPGINRNAVNEAAGLCKADITTELVKEFTELQGVVGGLYARAQGHAPEVADAIYDHYKPESMEDSVPRTIEGAVLSIADKADSIAGMFALGLQPTGSKDPFALRRAGNGIIKTLAETGLRLSVTVTLLTAFNGYKSSAVAPRFMAVDEFETAVRTFFYDRLQFYLRDVRGFSYDLVHAVMKAGAGYDDVVDVLARAQAVAAVRGSEDFESISIAFKRIRNILEQAREKGYAVPEGLSQEASGETAEAELHGTVWAVLPEFKHLVLHRDYPSALSEMAKLRRPIDAFFDKVMVLVEEPDVRARRLALLHTLLLQFSKIADFSEIVTEGKS